MPSITGGPLGCDEYYFTHAEFRWGPSENEGSEHMLDNQRFALELQLVHKSAENESSPLCVILAVLFEVSNSVDQGIHTISRKYDHF